MHGKSVFPGGPRPEARGFAFLAMLALVASCHAPSRSEDPHRESSHYDDPATWLCRPDLGSDACHGDLDATELLADGTQQRVPFVPAVDPKVDCFYIYPTVDLSLRAGNHTDFADPKGAKAIHDVAVAQIARYRQVCDVYAPLYRQISIGTYVFSSEAERDRFSDVAYADVTAAFKNYLEHYDRGRKLVIIGHSQGAQLATRLLHDTFDHDAALRARLLVGMPIGFDASVPSADGALVDPTALPSGSAAEPGQARLVGGSFDKIPVCTSDAQTGCIVSYRSIAAGDTPSNLFKLPPGRRAICVNPAGAADTAQHPLISVAPSEALERTGLHVDTPYVLERGFYLGRCVADPTGHDYLEISERHDPDDKRKPFVKLDKFHGGLGLHIFDLTLPQGNLIDLIATKLAASQK
jgi:hypothetical protein